MLGHVCAMYYSVDVCVFVCHYMSGVPHLQWK